MLILPEHLQELWAPSPQVVTWWQEIPGFHHLCGSLSPRENPSEPLCSRNVRALVPPALPWASYPLRAAQTLSDQTSSCTYWPLGGQREWTMDVTVLPHWQSCPALQHLLENTSAMPGPAEREGECSASCSAHPARWGRPIWQPSQGSLQAFHSSLPTLSHSTTLLEPEVQVKSIRKEEFTAPAVIALSIYAFSLLSPSSFVVLWTTFNLFNRLSQQEKRP